MVKVDADRYNTALIYKSLRNICKNNALATKFINKKVYKVSFRFLMFAWSMQIWFSIFYHQF